MEEPLFSPDRHHQTLESSKRLIRISREMRLGVTSLVDESRTVIDNSQHELDKRLSVVEQLRATVKTFYDQYLDSDD